MAIYRAGAEPSPSLLKLKRRAPWWFAGSLPLLILFVVLDFRYPPVNWSTWTAWALQGAAVIALMVTAFSGIATLQIKQMIRKSSQQEFEITPEGVTRRYPKLPEMFVPIGDVVSFDMRKGGLALWLRKNPRVLPVPANIENLDGFRQELIGLDIPESMMPSRRATLMKLLAIFAWVSVSWWILYFGKNLIFVGLAGISFVSFFAWTGYRSNNWYQGRKPRKWIWLLTIGLWLFVVAMRVERVMHPRHASVTPCAQQPSNAQPVKSVERHSPSEQKH